MIIKQFWEFDFIIDLGALTFSIKAEEYVCNESLWKIFALEYEKLNFISLSLSRGREVN